MKFLDKYEVLDYIAKGTYGVIFKVKDYSNNKEYIAKIQDIDKVADLDIIRRFKHEYIISFIDFFIEKDLNIKDKCIYKDHVLILILEKAKDDLNNYNLELLTKEDKIKILYQITKALLFLLNNDVLQLDLKLSNILIMEDKSIRLCDFGYISYLYEKYKSIVNYPIFSLDYSPPEEFENVKYINKKIKIVSINPKSYRRLITDKTLTWPLGIIFYQILSGKNLSNLIRFHNRNKYIKEYIIFFTENLDKNLENIENIEERILLKKMLNFNRNKRISIKNILQSNIFYKIHIPYISYKNPININLLSYKDIINSTVLSHNNNIYKNIPYIININNIPIHKILAVNLEFKTNTEIFFLSLDIYYRYQIKTQKYTYDNKIYLASLYLSILTTGNFIYPDIDQADIDQDMNFELSNLDINIKKIVEALDGIIYSDNYYILYNSELELIKSVRYIKNIYTYFKYLNYIPINDYEYETYSYKKSKYNSIQNFVKNLEPYDKNNVYKEYKNLKNPSENYDLYNMIKIMYLKSIDI